MSKVNKLLQCFYCWLWAAKYRLGQVKNTHVSTDHLPKNNPVDIAKKSLSYLYAYDTSFQAKLFCILEYSQNLKKRSFADINYINESVFNLFARSQRMHFYQFGHNSFAVNGAQWKSFLEGRIQTWIATVGIRFYQKC